MNKKKIIIIAIVLLILVVCIATGYIISLKAIAKNENKFVKMYTIEDEKDGTSQVNVNEDNIKDYKNVVLTSKIGNKILSKFCISNTYSNYLSKKLDSEGLSKDAKMLFTYVTIVSNYEYHNMIKQEEYYYYVLAEDFENVYKTLFGKDENVKHGSFMEQEIYDKEKNIYKYITLGYAGIDYDFTIEVPCKIREYEDRVEVDFYRIYATSKYVLKTDSADEQKIVLYSDSKRENEIYSSDDQRLQDNDSQIEYINELIENKEIKTDYIEKVTYYLKENNEEYFIKLFIKE